MSFPRDFAIYLARAFSHARLIFLLSSSSHTLSMPTFGSRKDINLGGQSSAVSLQQTLHAARDRRRVVMIQRRWRALYVARKTRECLPVFFDQDPTGVDGLRALVLMPHDDARLEKWSLAMTDGQCSLACVDEISIAPCSRLASKLDFSREIELARTLPTDCTTTFEICCGSRHVRSLIIFFTQIKTS
jgi:hypothetical protein